MQTSFYSDKENLIKLNLWIQKHKSVRFIGNPIKDNHGK